MNEVSNKGLRLRDFLFIRHGETDWNLKKIFQGQNDIPLNEKGREQAKRSQERIEKMNIDSIFSSPLKRALETAFILSKNLDLEVKTESLLMECRSEEAALEIYKSFGVTNYPSFIHLKEEDIESPERFIERSLKGIRHCLSQDFENSLIVSHGGTFWSLCKALEMKIIKAPNAVAIQVYKNFQNNWHYEIIK